MEAKSTHFNIMAETYDNRLVSTAGNESVLVETHTEDIHRVDVDNELLVSQFLIPELELVTTAESIQ